MTEQAIAETIRQARLAHDWSQSDLADRLGVHTMAVSRWERGIRTPRPKMRAALAELLELPRSSMGAPPPPEQTGDPDLLREIRDILADIRDQLAATPQ